MTANSRIICTLFLGMIPLGHDKSDISKSKRNGTLKKTKKQRQLVGLLSGKKM